MPITCASRKAGRWGGRSATKSTVPLCRGHHREVHCRGDEAAWWSNAGIDPAASARTLWLTTHPLPMAADEGHEVTSVETTNPEKNNQAEVGR